MKKKNLRRLESSRSVFLMIDVQERLLPAMFNKEEVVKNNRLLLEGCSLLEVETLISEQYPRGLGSTVEELKPWVTEENRYEKTSFSFYDDQKKLVEKLIKNGKDQFIISGTESHVCVYQTVRDLLERGGVQVIVAFDAIGSRAKENTERILNTFSSMGALVLPTETILFELQRKAGTPTFKEISNLVK